VANLIDVCSVKVWIMLQTFAKLLEEVDDWEKLLPRCVEL
jgi:hypothetical protein